MSNMTINFNGYNGTVASPLSVERRPCGKSQTVKIGVPLVLTSYTSVAQTTSLPCLRPLSSADIDTSSHYYTADHSTGSIAGLAGFSVEAWASDSSGVPNGDPYASSSSVKSLMAEPVLGPVANYPFLGQPDPTGGGGRAAFAVCHKDNVFFTDQLYTGETMSSLYEGKAAGLNYNSSTGLYEIRLSGAGASPLIIDKWDKYYGLIYFHVIDTYNQLLNGVPYTAA
jgi:hypothetical protein